MATNMLNLTKVENQTILTDVTRIFVFVGKSFSRENVRKSLGYSGIMYVP